MDKIKLGFAITGSFCTFRAVIEEMRAIKNGGKYDIYPIMSYNAARTDTRFGNAQDFVTEIEEVCGRKVISTMTEAEPIGPSKTFDVMAVVPCTGNTLAKLANAITDTPVAMAAKAHLRNERPLVLAVSTNDALSGSAKNLGLMLSVKNIYFVPMYQDDPSKKPRSIVSKLNKLDETIKLAVQGKQIQPIFS